MKDGNGNRNGKERQMTERYEYALRLTLENPEGDIWYLTFAHYWTRTAAQHKGAELVGQTAFGSKVTSFLVIDNGKKKTV